MMKRKYPFLLTLILMMLCLFSCNHKSARETLSLSEAENKIAADADAILGLWKTKSRPDKNSETHLSSPEEEITAIGNGTLPMSGSEKISFSNPPRACSFDTAIVRGYNKFAYNFLASAVRNTEDPNIIVSPLSLEMLLSVLANGADSAAMEEILSYLNAPSLKALNDVNRDWLWLCKNPGEYTDFSLANSIWVSDEIGLKSKFSRDMKQDYDMSIHALSADIVQSQKEINLWAKENTNGMIPEFLKEPLKPTVKLALYNASYFEGMWRSKCWIRKGYLSSFKTSAGELELEMMHNNFIGVNYYETDKYRGMDLDYYGEIFCMRVIVPNDGYTLEEVMNTLAKGIVKPEKRSVLLHMPKFKIRHRIENLKDILKASGLGIVFDNPACFSYITSHPGLFEEAKLYQEAVIECDENGTKVAAVTGFALAWDSGKRIEYVHFNVDRPFIFLILERKSGAVMFAGVVRDPTK